MNFTKGPDHLDRHHRHPETMNSRCIKQLSPNLNKKSLAILRLNLSNSIRCLQKIPMNRDPPWNSFSPHLKQLPHREDIAIHDGLFQLIEVRRQSVTEVIARIAMGKLAFLAHEKTGRVKEGVTSDAVFLERPCDKNMRVTKPCLEVEKSFSFALHVFSQKTKCKTYNIYIYAYTVYLII